MTPDDYTIKETFLEVGDGHSLYVHDWGNPNAKNPVMFLHGGPGTGCGDHYKNLFDPKQHHVIFHDQRGSGRSLPYGSLDHNKTEDLVEDIEKIATHLKLGRLTITGGSWGSFLALAFAIKYPDRVEKLLLRGIFTGTQPELDYVDQGQFKTFFPDVWQNMLDQTPKAHHHNPTQYHYDRILGNDPEAAKSSAYAYSNLEGAIMSLDDRFTPEPIEEFDPAPTTIEVHYLANNCFVPEGYLLDNAHKIKIPVWLVQGRYDMVCPPEAAYNLDQALPNSRLMWTTAGHSNRDRATFDVMRSLYLQLAL